MEGTAAATFESASAAPSPQPSSASVSHEPSRAASPMDSTTNDINQSDVVMVDIPTSTADNNAKSKGAGKQQQKQNKNNNNNNNNNTNPAVRSKPALKGEDGFKRMNFLFQASTSLALTNNRACVSLSRMHLASMKRVAAKLVLRLDPTIKNCICKRCGSMLIPAHSAKVDVLSSGSAEDIRWSKNSSKKQKTTVKHSPTDTSNACTSVTTTAFPTTPSTLAPITDSVSSTSSSDTSNNNHNSSNHATTAALKSESTPIVIHASVSVAIDSASTTAAASSTENKSRKRKRKPHAQRKKGETTSTTNQANPNDTPSISSAAVAPGASSVIASSPLLSAAPSAAESPIPTAAAVTEWILDDTSHIQYTCFTCGTKKRIHTKQQVPFVETATQ